MKSSDASKSSRLVPQFERKHQRQAESIRLFAPILPVLTAVVLALSWASNPAVWGTEHIATAVGLVGLITVATFGMMILFDPSIPVVGPDWIELPRSARINGAGGRIRIPDIQSCVAKRNGVIEIVVKDGANQAFIAALLEMYQDESGQTLLSWLRKQGNDRGALRVTDPMSDDRAHER